MSDTLEDLIARLFIARPDVKAVQQNNGAWHPDVDHTHGRDAECPGTCPHRKFNRTDLSDHLAGTKTYGHYLLSKDSKSKFFCYDLDLKTTGIWFDDLNSSHEFNPREEWLKLDAPSREWQILQLRCLAEGLALRVQRTMGLGTAITYSGSKGLHVYGFSNEGAIDAGDLRNAAKYTLESWGCFKQVKGEHFWEHEHKDQTGYPNIQIEVFPKQDTLDGKDFGNLLRLPLGINKKSGQEGFFVDVTKGMNILEPADPVRSLTVLDPWKLK